MASTLTPSRSREQRLQNEALVLDMGEYVHASTNREALANGLIVGGGVLDIVHSPSAKVWFRRTMIIQEHVLIYILLVVLG